MTEFNIKIFKRYLTITMMVLAVLIIGINVISSYIAIINTVNLHVDYSQYELKKFSDEVRQKVVNNKKVANHEYSSIAVC